MAEVNSNEGAGGKPQGRRPKQRKKSTRIDMTAMVDVAFLLLTFFILTTTLSEPYKFELINPNDESAVSVPQSKVMTILLGEDNTVYAYYYAEGSDAPIVKTTDFSDDGIRKDILEHLNRHPHRCPGGAEAGEIKESQCWDPIYVIKPTKSSKYQNLIDLLDEMHINNAEKYALASFTPDDSLFMVEHGLQ